MSGIITKNIGNNQFTYGKIQQVSSSKILGNPGSAGNISELSIGTNLSFSGTTLNASGGTPATPSVSANDSNLSFGTGSNLNQLACNPTAARVYTLDNTFLAGQTLTFKNIANTDGNYITIEANDASIIAILPATGTITLTTQSDTPSTNTNWKVISKQSNWVSYVPTFTAFGTVSGVHAAYRIVDNFMQIQMNLQPGTTTSSVGVVTIPSAFLVDNSNGSSNFGYLFNYLTDPDNGWQTMFIYNNTTSFQTCGGLPNNNTGYPLDNYVTSSYLVFASMFFPIKY